MQPYSITEITFSLSLPVCDKDEVIAVCSLDEGSLCVREQIRQLDIPQKDYRVVIIYDQNKLPVAQISYWGQVFELNSERAFPLLDAQYDPQHEQLRLISLVYDLSVFVRLPARHVGDAWFEIPQLIPCTKVYPFRVALSPGKGFHVEMYPRGTRQNNTTAHPLEVAKMAIYTNPPVEVERKSEQ